MQSPPLTMTSALLFFVAVTAGPAIAGDAASVGTGISVPAPATTDRGCGTPVFNNDGTYENGYAWRTGGQVPPYYGAFAECFQGGFAVCALLFDLTQVGGYNNQTADLYFWSNLRNLDRDEPGGVLYMIPGAHMGSIAFWPAISRNVINLSNDQIMGGRWWVGIWGNWPGTVNSWFIAADTDGTSPTGCPMNNIAPGIGYPTGWQSVSVAWGPTNGIGIGIQATPITSDVPEGGVRRTTFGRVKALFR